MSLSNVLIVGAGPAGMTAALQLKRYGIECTLYEKTRLGGLLNNANLVENYPGFPGGIPGPALVALFEQQLQAVGAGVTHAEVLSLDYSEGKFQLTTQTGEHEAAIAVVASGTRPRRFTQLDIPEAVQSRVHYEIYPLLQLEGKRIAIVGAGDAAFDYALNLGKKNDVTILNRSETVKCLPLLWERTQAAQGIHYYSNTAVLAVLEHPQGGLLVAHTSTQGDALLEVDYLIGALGREACLDFISPRLLAQVDELHKRGMLYFIGDVKNELYRQTAIAVGDGILAAMKIFETLRNRSV